MAIFLTNFIINYFNASHAWMLLGLIIEVTFWVLCFMGYALELSEEHKEE